MTTENLQAAASRCFIAGRWCEGENAFSVADPFTGQAFAQVSTPSPAQLQEAVRAAAQASAHRLQAYDRARVLSAARDLLAQRSAQFRACMVREGGFTVAEMDGEIQRALATLDICAQEARRIHGEMIPLQGAPGQEDRIAFTIRRPVGVVCAITPFNSPLNAVLHKVGPALAAGNAVILKPSPRTPLTAALACELLLDAGLPPALLTLVQGDADIGEALLREQAIDYYSFTGSTRVGRLVQAGAGLRRTHLELGSIACTVVCADADLDAALPRLVSASFRRAGQFCTSIQRMYVQAPVAGELLARFTAAAEALRSGDPNDAATQVGPMISAREAERAERWVREAGGAGAHIETGGTRAGAVLRPTVLTRVAAGMRVIDEEIFAPVVSLIPFDHVDEAFSQINQLPYGLAAGVFTRSLDTGLAAAHALRMGSVHINDTASSRTDNMPYGGVKDSGHGREGPRYAIQEMTEERVVTLRPSRQQMEAVA